MKLGWSYDAEADQWVFATNRGVTLRVDPDVASGESAKAALYRTDGVMFLLVPDKEPTARAKSKPTEEEAD